MLAFRFSDISVIQKLISIQTFDINDSDENSHSPTMIAVLRSSPQILSLLIHNREDINWNLQDKNGNTIAILAVKTNNEDCLNIIKNKSEINWNIKNKYQSFHIAL